MRFLVISILLISSSASQAEALSNIYFPDSTRTKRQIRIENRKKDTVAWISQDDKLIFGSEISQLHVNLDMDNFFNNATDSNIFRFKGLDHWKFTTSHDPEGISYYLNSRFGKFSFFSHKVPGTYQPGEFKSSFKSLGYAYQFKKILMYASYKKISGFVRDNEYTKIKDTLTGMTATDYRFAFEFIGLGSSEFNKYGFSQLYIPVKGSGYMNFKFESVYMTFRDKNGVIPFVSGINWNPANANWDINYDNAGYMQKFNLYVQSLYIHILGIIPLLKQKGVKPKSLSFRIDLNEGLDLYYYTVSPGANGVEKSGLKFRAITNLFMSGALVYCDRNLLVGAAFYYRANSFSDDFDPSINYYLRTISANVAFRIPFKKPYQKIDNSMDKLFHRSKT